MHQENKQNSSIIPTSHQHNTSKIQWCDINGTPTNSNVTLKRKKNEEQLNTNKTPRNYHRNTVNPSMDINPSQTSRQRKLCRLKRDSGSTEQISTSPPMTPICKLKHLQKLITVTQSIFRVFRDGDGVEVV